MRKEDYDKKAEGLLDDAQRIFHEVAAKEGIAGVSSMRNRGDLKLFLDVYWPLEIATWQLRGRERVFACTWTSVKDRKGSRWTFKFSTYVQYDRQCGDFARAGLEGYLLECDILNPDGYHEAVHTIYRENFSKYHKWTGDPGALGRWTIYDA